MREHLSRSRTTDRAVLSFDLDADLQGVFNWNVKQLFVYVTADFHTKSISQNEVVVWDSIITSKESSRLQLQGALNKYPIFDQNTELRGTNVSLTLHWDVMPIMGMMHLQRKGSFSMRMPSDYCKDAECRPHMGKFVAV